MVSQDPTAMVKYAKTKVKFLPNWAVPVFVGNLVPGRTTLGAWWFKGSNLMAQFMGDVVTQEVLPALGARPQSLETGLELADDGKRRALADPARHRERLQQLALGVEYAEEAAVDALGQLVREGRDLSPKAKPEDAQAFHAKAEEAFRGPLREFDGAFELQGSSQVLLEEMKRVAPAFETPASQPLTRREVLTGLETIGTQVDVEVVDRDRQIAERFSPVIPQYAAALGYFLNAGFGGEACFVHVPPGTPQDQVAAYVIEELQEAKLRCADILLLEPVRSPAVLTAHWAPHFHSGPAVHAMVWAGLEYRNARHLREIAKATKLVAGPGAGHCILVAGWGTVLGRYRVPVHTFVAGARRRIDGALDPRNSHFGVLESGFGPQDDKAVFGVEDVDTLGPEWKDRHRADLAASGFSTLAETEGLIHAFRLRNLSADVQYSQADAMRAYQWFLGTARKYLRKVAIGRCIDSTLKTQVVKELAELLLGPFPGKADIALEIGPGESQDPRDFDIYLGLPTLVFAERVILHAQLLGDK